MCTKRKKERKKQRKRRQTKQGDDRGKRAGQGRRRVNRSNETESAPQASIASFVGSLDRLLGLLIYIYIRTWSAVFDVILVTLKFAVAPVSTRTPPPSCVCTKRKKDRKKRQTKQGDDRGKRAGQGRRRVNRSNETESAPQASIASFVGSLDRLLGLFIYIYIRTSPAVFDVI